MKINTILEPFAKGYLESKYDDIEYRIAAGMHERAKLMPIVIPENYIFAGYFDKEDPCFVTYNSGRGLHVEEDKFKKRAEQFPEEKDALSEIYELMKNRSVTHLIHSKTTERDEDMVNYKAGWGGGVRDWAGGHSNPDYMMREGRTVSERKSQSIRK